MTSNTFLLGTAVAAAALCGAAFTASAADRHRLPEAPHGASASSAGRAAPVTAPKATIRRGGGNSTGAPPSKPAPAASGGWDVTTNKRV